MKMNPTQGPYIVIKCMLEHSPAHINDIRKALPREWRDQASAIANTVWKRLGSDHIHAANIISRKSGRYGAFTYTRDPLLTTTVEQAVTLYETVNKKQNRNPVKRGTPMVPNRKPKPRGAPKAPKESNVWRAIEDAVSDLLGTDVQVTRVDMIWRQG